MSDLVTQGLPRGRRGEVSDTRRVYGQWAGNSKGVLEDQTRCIESVMDNYIGRQCGRKRGFGKDGLYCKQHAKYHPADEGGGEK